MLRDYFFTQYVTFPTRDNNTLDLVFSTHHIANVNPFYFIPSCDHAQIGFEIPSNQNAELVRQPHFTRITDWSRYSDICESID